MIRAITIEREYGCGAAAIGKALAEQLGWKLWDEEITAAIARHLKCDKRSVEEREERVDSVFYRLIKVFMRGSYEASMNGQELELLDAENLAHMFEKVVVDAANEGRCVIIGRAAPWFLRDRDDAFRVFIYAPYGEKIRRTVAQGKSLREAEHLLETVDGERAVFIRKYYNKDWPDRGIYHLMVNSAIGDEKVVRLILAEIAMLEEPVTRAAG
jgi:cytidylate kinase